MVGGKKNISSGLLWTFIGTSGQHILQFVGVLILARLLTPEDFGIVAASMIIIGLVNVFAGMGVGPAIVQVKSLNDATVATGKTLSAVFGALMGIFVYWGAAPYEMFIGVSGVEETIHILAWVLPIAGLTVVPLAVLQRNFKFKKLILFTFISHAIGHLLVAIPLAYLGCGKDALVYGTLAQSVSLMLMANFGQSYTGYKFDLTSAGKIINFGSGQSLGELANYSAGQIDNLLVGKFLGVSALGFYSRAYQLMLMPASLIGGVIDKVMFPVMSSVQDDNEKLSEMFVTINSVLMMIFVPIAATIIISSDEIISLLYGPAWLPAAPILSILGAVVFFRAAAKISDSLSRAKGSVYRRAWRQLVYAGFVGGGAYIGSWYGLEAVAISVSLSIIVNYVLMLHLSYSLISFDVLRFSLIFFKNTAVFGAVLLILECVKAFITAEISGELSIIFLCTAISLLSCLVLWGTFKKFFRLELAVLQQSYRPWLK